jgi:hypothetical protein
MPPRQATSNITTDHTRHRGAKEQQTLARTQTNPTSQIDRIRAIHPRYADFLEKNSELHARYEDVLAESRPRAEEERRHDISWVQQTPQPKPKPKVRHAGAVAILGDLLPEQPHEELNPPPLRRSWPGEDRLRALGAESEAIGEALRLLAPELRKARREYSTLVATQRKAEYQALAEDVVDAGRKLGDAIIQHHAFIDEQRRDSVAYQSFKPLNLSVFGNLNGPGSILMQMIVDAVERSHVGAGKVPEWKMPADISQFQGGEF